MGWIGASHRSGWRHRHAPAPGAPGCTPETLMPRGTLLVETDVLPARRPQTLLSVRRDHPWEASLALQALPGGGVTLVESQNGEPRHATVDRGREARAETMRLTYCWDAPRRIGRLSVERPGGTGELRLAPLAAPHPKPLAELLAAVADPRRRRADTAPALVALSDGAEPVGPMPGLTGRVPVLTPSGPAPAAALRRGDCVITDAGEVVPVLQAVRRTVPAFGTFRPVRLRAPYFGLSRDIVVAPEQRIVMSGSQVEYLFGREAVLVPARHLINGISAVPASGPDFVIYHQILLPGHEAVLAAGCPLESLYIGRLRRQPERLAASVLVGCDRACLPEHAGPVRPVLRPFEAITLAQGHAA